MTEDVKKYGFVIIGSGVLVLLTAFGLFYRKAGMDDQAAGFYGPQGSQQLNCPIRNQWGLVPQGCLRGNYFNCPVNGPMGQVLQACPQQNYFIAQQWPGQIPTQNQPWPAQPTIFPNNPIQLAALPSNCLTLQIGVKLVGKGEVIEVMPGSPAERAGIQVGDIINRINGS